MSIQEAIIGCEYCQFSFFGRYLSRKKEIEVLLETDPVHVRDFFQTFHQASGSLRVRPYNPPPPRNPEPVVLKTSHHTICIKSAWNSTFC